MSKILTTPGGKVLKTAAGKILTKPVPPPPDYLCFTAQEANSTVELCRVGYPIISDTAYSMDGNTWITFEPSEGEGVNVVTLANVGDRVYFRNNIIGYFADYSYLNFKMSGLIAASGNINSMYMASGFDELTTLTYTHCYAYMFQGCTSLKTAPALPATTLAAHCYYYMFSGCTSLTTAPALPATTLKDYCYASMFYGCTSLTTAPELPATTLASYCYRNMFSGCTSLTTAPALPATTLKDYCYASMFSGCTSLTTAPELPATTLANSCYSYMFSGCTSLTTAPELPATILTWYWYCYQSMFQGCTSLLTAPALPATTLDRHCYDCMFFGCTSLTTAPALPATTLGWNCYIHMFSYCTSLQVSDTQTTEAPYAWTIPTSGTFINTYDQSYMFLGCAGARSSNDMAGAQGQSYTYYTQNPPVS